jgi:adenylyltransferase/sulfurtransferase
MISKFPGCDTNISVRNVAKETASLPNDQTILIVCKLGHRAQLAREILVNLGFERSIVLHGGINGWAIEIDPSIATY